MLSTYVENMLSKSIDLGVSRLLFSLVSRFYAHCLYRHIYTHIHTYTYIRAYTYYTLTETWKRTNALFSQGVLLNADVRTYFQRIIINPFCWNGISCPLWLSSINLFICKCPQKYYGHQRCWSYLLTCVPFSDSFSSSISLSILITE